jgi:hypothetical protein
VDILTLQEMVGFFVAFWGGNMGEKYILGNKKGSNKIAESLSITW